MEGTPTRKLVSRIAVILALGFCISPFGSPPLALLTGIFIALMLENPFDFLKGKVITVLLQCSVVGLGFGIHISKAIQAGKTGIIFTVFSITATLLLGKLIGKWLKVENKIAYLIACGTAICGGSAIAAVAPIIKAEKDQISVALGTVFILNAIALFIFPPIATYLNLPPFDFGVWCAIAIHDTSSVVGAASKFGAIALESATTIKLTRTLWIIPLAITSSYLYKNKESKVKIPYFILYFVIAMLLNSFIPVIAQLSPYIVGLSRKGLTITLFLIGLGLSPSSLRTVGIKPFIQGVVLWVLISVLSILVIVNHWLV